MNLGPLTLPAEAEESGTKGAGEGAEEEETVAAGASYEEIIEKIDIGGPSMLRSAAKNHDSVAVVCDPADYARVAAEIADGGTTMDLRRALARKVFQRTGAYDSAIGQWFMREEGCGLRYGENPHQSAAFFSDMDGQGLGGAEDRERVAISDPAPV